MRDAFKRSEECRDLDKIAEDPIEQKRDEMKTKLETMTQDELAQVQELLENNNGKTCAGRECQQLTR